MKPHRTRKKNLIVSYKNLSDELKKRFKEAYPDGYSDHLQRFDKPNGEAIFVVPMETEDTVYMIKFDVKIDTTLTDDVDEKDIYDDEIEKANDDFAPLTEAIDKEENKESHTEHSIRHGDYEEAFSPAKKKRGTLSGLGKELEEAFDANGDEEEYGNDDLDDQDDLSKDDFEPSDEDLMDIDSDFFMTSAEVPAEEQEPQEDEQPAAKAKRGRPRKDANDAAAATPVPKKKGRPRKKNTSEE